MNHILSIDITETRSAVGGVDLPGQDNCPILGTREGRTWHLRAGTSDEYRSQGSTLAIAVKRLAKELGVTGTGVIGRDAGGSDVVIDLVTGKVVEAAPVATEEPQESATEFVPTHRVTWYVNADSTRKYEYVVLLRQDTHTDYGFLYGTARVIGQAGKFDVLGRPEGTPYERSISFGRYNALAIEPLHQPQKSAPEETTASSAEYFLPSGEFVAVVQAYPDATVKITSLGYPLERTVCVVSAFDLTPEREYEYSEEAREAARENRTAMIADSVAETRAAVAGREAGGEILADWERELLASVPESRVDRPNLRPETPERAARRAARNDAAAARTEHIGHQEPGVDYEDLAIDTAGSSWIDQLDN